VPRRVPLYLRDNFWPFVPFDSSSIGDISQRFDRDILRKIVYNEGDRVREGMLLAKIDDPI